MLPAVWCLATPRMMLSCEYHLMFAEYNFCGSELICEKLKIRVLSTAGTTPSAAAKTMFTFTGVPAFVKALMYACTSVSTSPRVDVLVSSMQYFSPQVQWLHYVSPSSTPRSSAPWTKERCFSELTTFNVCLELLHCSCVSMLRSVFSIGSSSLFSSTHCVRFTLSRPLCLHLE